MHRHNRSARKLNRSQRTAHRFQDREEDVVNLDWDKPLNHIAHQILSAIIRKDLPRSQLLAYLNSFTKYCLKRFAEQTADSSIKPTPDNNSSLTVHHQSELESNDHITYNEVLSCLRLNLFHDAAEVRAATLRAIRYYLKRRDVLHSLIELNVQHLVARSLDLLLENENERIQALRLIRHILLLEPNAFPLALGRCLCATASDISSEKNKLVRICWATIAELTTVNAIASARSGCIAVLTKCAITAAIGNNAARDCGDLDRDTARDHHGNNHESGRSSRAISGVMTNISLTYNGIVLSEAILVSFLHLFNWPDTRRLLAPKGSDLFSFISPFTDRYSFLHASNAARLHQNLLHHEMVDNLFEDNLKLVAEHKDNRQPNKQLQQSIISFESRTLHYQACKYALLSILRSWPGMFYMCRTMVNPESRLDPTHSDKDNLWDYEEIYRQTGEQNNRLLLDSLRFFGISENRVPSRITRIVRGIGRGMETNNGQTSSSSYFTTTSYGSLNPLESLISIFHLPYPEVHRHLIEFVYELFGLKCPEWLVNFDEALQCVNFFPVSKKYKQAKSTNNEYNSAQPVKCYFPEEWQLSEGFVVKEAEQILPNLARNRMNFIVNYCALLLQALVEFGLLDALVSVILDSVDQAAVNLTTILLGELLHLSGRYLPASIYAHRCQSLPTLVAASISDCKTRRNRALMTISRLSHIHELKKRGAKPSLFLEQQLYFSEVARQQSTQSFSKTVHYQSTVASKTNDENVQSMIKNSHVLRRTNFRDWNWEIVIEILKHPGEGLRKLEEKDTHRAFVRRLVEFFRPSKRLFSMVSKNSSLGMSDYSGSTSSGLRSDPIYVENPHLFCLAAIQFVDFLLNADENRMGEFTEEFIRDLDLCLRNVAHKCPSSDEVLIQSRLMSTLSHQYFLLLGRFTHSPVGRRWLDQTHIYQYLLDLIVLPNNEVYIKLIVCSLDYNALNFGHTLLSKMLTSTTPDSQLFVTKYLRVLLRTRAHNFSKWGIEFLVGQLVDKSKAVKYAALDILDEACSENEECLENVISLRPNFLALGDLGVLFFARYASHPTGMNYLRESCMLGNELARWQGNFGARYVRMVEDSLNECFSCHQRSADGIYGRRSDRRSYFPHTELISTAYVPPHLYGQLVQTEAGLQIVREKDILREPCNLINKHLNSLIHHSSTCVSSDPQPSEANILRLKAALWSIGHLCTSERGISYILEQVQPILGWITTLARRSLVLSLRATCFYTISLIASTRSGARMLTEFGWTAIQHSHNDLFPIDQQEYDNFYFNGRPRFMSDPDHLFPPGGMASLGSTSFMSNEDNTLQPTPPHYSQSSSRSSSSSYLAIKPSGQSQDRFRNGYKATKELSTSFALSSSLSSASIYSNNSSLGCLTTNINTTVTTTCSRPRSSSDCVPTVTFALEKKIPLNHNNQLVNSSLHTKPEYQDSGILDQTNGIEHKPPVIVDNATSWRTSRNRKISAPCFPFSFDTSREVRSDSNDSAQTANTALSNETTGSRSTSFAEYSTSSSGSHMVEMPKMDRSVSFSPDPTARVECSNYVSMPPISPVSPNENCFGGRRFDRSLSNRQMSLLVQNDDPFPSPVDAHGYAQLQAIQKRRVQSLSGNMFFSGLPNPGSIVDQLNFEFESSAKYGKNVRVHSNSIRSDETMPEILVNDQHSNCISAASSSRQRKVSRSSLPPNSPVETQMDTKRMLSFPIGEELHQSGSQSRLIGNVPHSSKGSFHSMESVGTVGLDDLSLDDFSSLNGANQKADRTIFMCLCLPDSLSLIFHIDDEEEDSCSNSKVKRVQFVNKTEQNQEEKIRNQNKHSQNPATLAHSCSLPKSKMEAIHKGLDLHSSAKCMACCFNADSSSHRRQSGGIVSTQGSPTSNERDNNNAPKVTSQQSKLKTTELRSDQTNGDRSVECGPPSLRLVTAPTLSNVPAYRKEVLRLVGILSGSQFAKQAEQALLRYPSVFEDICLYSEVCLQMEFSNFRASARRFLHELFLDVNLDQLYKVAESIIKRQAASLAIKLEVKNSLSISQASPLKSE